MTGNNVATIRLQSISVQWHTKPQTFLTTIHCSPLCTCHSHTSPQFQSNRTKTLRFSQILTAIFNPSESETLRDSRRLATRFDPIANQTLRTSTRAQNCSARNPKLREQISPPTDEMRHPNHNAYVTRLRFKMASPGNSLNNLKQHP